MMPFLVLRAISDLKIAVEVDWWSNDGFDNTELVRRFLVMPKAKIPVDDPNRSFHPCTGYNVFQRRNGF